jgi:hypothetical protein
MLAAGTATTPKVVPTASILPDTTCCDESTELPTAGDQPPPCTLWISSSAWRTPGGSWPGSYATFSVASLLKVTAGPSSYALPDTTRSGWGTEVVGCAVNSTVVSRAPGGTEMVTDPPASEAVPPLAPMAVDPGPVLPLPHANTEKTSIGRSASGSLRSHIPTHHGGGAGRALRQGQVLLFILFINHPGACGITLRPLPGSSNLHEHHIRQTSGGSRAERKPRSPRPGPPLNLWGVSAPPVPPCLPARHRPPASRRPASRPAAPARR